MTVWEWIVGLVIVGSVLICIEMFVPGMVLGIIGACCLFAAIVMAFRHLGIQAGVGVFIGVTVIVAGLFAGWIYYLPRSPMAQWMMLKETNPGKKVDPLDTLAGKLGTTQTTCRPAGVALIEGRRVDVVSEHTFIEAGTPVRVVQVEGQRVVVQPVPAGGPK